MNERARTDFRHTYHLNPGRLLVLPIVWTVIVASLLSFAFSGAEDSAGEQRSMLITCAVVTLIVLPFGAVTWFSRLVLTPGGIAHYQLGYTVRSTWANLEALQLRPGSEALYLRAPGTRSVLLRLSVNLVGSAVRNAQNVIGDSNALAEGRLIYLAPFMRHWKRGPLREDLLRCAPHLFDGGGTKSGL
jgi:hypothetical protein